MKSAGFSVIEVLVALIVISIGLLGLANLQLAGLRQAHSAMLHTQATTLAHDVIDRMRGNYPGFSLGAYDTAFTAVPPDPAAVPVCNTVASDCTPAQIALADLVEWKCMLGAWESVALCAGTLGTVAQLPGGDAEILRTGDDTTVTVRWQDRSNTLPPVFTVTTSVKP